VKTNLRTREESTDMVYEKERRRRKRQTTSVKKLLPGRCKQDADKIKSSPGLKLHSEKRTASDLNQKAQEPPGDKRGGPKRNTTTEKDRKRGYRGMEGQNSTTTKKNLENNATPDERRDRFIVSGQGT